MKNILYQESIVEIKHLFRMMRNTLLALFVFAGTAFATESYSQTMKVTVVADNVSTGKVISEIEKQTDYLFVYNVNEVNLKRNVKVNAQNKSVAEVLNKVFEGTDIYYAMEGKNIMLMSKAKDGEAAQQANKVTGIVKDANGEPVIGANVMVKGQSIGTITDIDGRFVLDAPKEAVLQITYIGYVSQEVKVSGKREINVVLKEDTETLDEVVVVGFGTQKKVNLTGAVGLATAKELESRPVTSATQALQGLVPGLQIYTVNPQDIENISVLKDAAASSIYGSRAPFGVILVTTKSGKKGKTNINYNNSFRISTPINMPEMMDSYTFANFMNSGSLNQGGGLIFTEDLMREMLNWQAAGGGSTGGVKASSNGQWGKPEYDPFTTAWANTNWYDEVYKSSTFSQEHNVSLNGGSDIVAYYASFNYLDQGGLLKAGDDGLQRYNVTAKINANLTPWLKFNYSTRFTRNDVWRPTSFNSSFYDQLGRATWPNLPVKDPNGYYLDNGWTNPVQNLSEGGKRNAQTDRLYQQASLIIEPIKNWTTHVEFNYSIKNSSVKETSLPVYNHDIEGNVINTNKDSYLYQDQTKENYLNLNIYSEYFHSFNNILRRGSRWQWSPSFSLGWNIAQEKFWESLTDIANTLKLRVSYGELGNQNTTAWYPTYRDMILKSSNGTWLQDNQKPNTAEPGDLVSNSLTWEKVRTWDVGFDYGFFNNRLTGSFDYYIRYTDGMVGPAPELPSTLGTSAPKTNNCNLRTNGWELSIGWRDRLNSGLGYSATFTLSDAKTIVTSYPSNATNTIGLNKYVEGREIGEIWGLQTIGIAKSEEEMQAHLSSLPKGGQEAIGSKWSAGDIMYRDLNGDGKISKGASTLDDHGDLKVIGNSTPRYFFGIDLNADWKGFDVRLFFQGVMKRDYWGKDNFCGYLFGARGDKDMWHARGLVEHQDYFRAQAIGIDGHELPANLDAYYPRPVFKEGAKNQETQSRYLQDASFDQMPCVCFRRKSLDWNIIVFFV